MAAVARTSVAPAYAYTTYSSSMASHYFQDPSFRLMTPGPKNNSKSAGPYPLSRVYVKYIRRAWKRVSRATRKPERASVLPDGFVLINNARLGAAARRKSILFA